MGVRRSDWVVIGVNIGMEHYDDDNYEYFDRYDRKKESGDITFIIDGMSGKYFIIGEVVSYGDEYDGLGLTSIPLDNKFQESAERVKKFIRKEFDIAHIKDPELIILTHWD